MATHNKDFERLSKIIFYSDSIIAFTKSRTRQDFKHHNEFRFALVFALSQIGEEANKLTKEIQKQHPHIPWKDILSLRHKIVHDYKGLHDDVIWETATSDIPQLINEIRNIKEPLQ